MAGFSHTHKVGFLITWLYYYLKKRTHNKNSIIILSFFRCPFNTDLNNPNYPKIEILKAIKCPTKKPKYLKYVEKPIHFIEQT